MLNCYRLIQHLFRYLRPYVVRVLFLISLAFCLWLGHISPFLGQPSSPIAIAQTPSRSDSAQTLDANQRVEQGVNAYQAGNYAEAISAWQAALSIYQSHRNLPNQAIVLENLARAYQTTGQLSQALTHWEQATTVYRDLKNAQMVGRMLTEQAQTYTRLGQYRKSIALLCNPTADPLTCADGSAVQIGRSIHDPMGTLTAWGSLGEAYRLRGDYDPALQALKNGAEIAETLAEPHYQSALAKSLGNVYVSLAQISYRRANSAEKIGEPKAQSLRQEGEAHDRDALAAFQKSLDTSEQGPLRVGVLLDAIPVAYRVNQPSTATAYTQEVIALLQTLPDSQEKVYVAIDLSQVLQPVSPDQPFSRRQCLDPAVASQSLLLLQQALTTAQSIHDRRSESFALGELGHWYECQKDYAQALSLTQQARQAADREPDSRYLWEWQTGRILKLQGEEEAAIPIYERAIQTLDTIRDDILATKRDIQFDFRDTIEPLYRELVELQLSQGQPSVLIPESEPRHDNVSATLKTLDSLKLAELQNYFGNDCVLISFDATAVTLVGQETATAIFNSIILNDRTAIVVTFPDGQQQFEWIPVDQQTLTTELNHYRYGLERFFDAEVGYDPQQAQILYDQLIRPFATNLEQAQIKTLVFVQDGILRSIPMTALHDGHQFLVQKYAIATTPSLTLTNPNPLNRRNLKALAVGLTASATVEGQPPFEPLPNVRAEIQAVTTILPDSKPLFDQEFTRDRLQQELDRTGYPIVHIATHGKFGTEPQDTFLVTGNNQKLTLDDLDRLLRSADPTRPVELLALTACETAVGDDRAALGLAGVAAQAGAKSVLASLWFINDAATSQLVDQFYKLIQSQPNLSKAEALQMAQKSLIESEGRYAHPAFWAPFILIGNWL